MGPPLQAMLEAGCSDEVVFLFLRDTQLVHDDILEDVNGLLRSGEMFGLVGLSVTLVATAYFLETLWSFWGDLRSPPTSQCVHTYTS